MPTITPHTLALPIVAENGDPSAGAAAMQAAVSYLRTEGGGVMTLLPSRYNINAQVVVDGVDLIVEWSGAEISYTGGGSLFSLVNGGTVTFRPALSPELFGAKGDGEVDDIDALDAARATMAGTSQMMVLLAGRAYGLSRPFRNTSDHDLRIAGGFMAGEFPGGVTALNMPHIVELPGFLGDALIEWGAAGGAGAASSPGFSGFGIKGLRTSGVTGLRFLTSSTVHLRDMRITNCGDYGLELLGCFWNTIENTTIRFCRIGAHVGFDSTNNRKCDSTAFKKCLINNNEEGNLLVDGPDAGGLANQHGQIVVDESLIELVPGASGGAGGPLVTLSNAISVLFRGGKLPQNSAISSPCIQVGAGVGHAGRVRHLSLEGTIVNHGGSASGSAIQFVTPAADEPGKGFIDLNLEIGELNGGSNWIDAAGLDANSKVRARGLTDKATAVSNDGGNNVAWTDLTA